MALWRSYAGFCLPHSLQRGLFPSSVIGGGVFNLVGATQLKRVIAAAGRWVGEENISRIRLDRPRPTRNVLKWFLRGSHWKISDDGGLGPYRVAGRGFAISFSARRWWAETRRLFRRRSAPACLNRWGAQSMRRSLTVRPCESVDDEARGSMALD